MSEPELERDPMEEYWEGIHNEMSNPYNGNREDD